MKYIGIIFLLITIACGKESGHSSLFNGENLEGWSIYGTEKWYVEDGLLICESGPDEAYGYLATNIFLAITDSCTLSL